MKNPFDDWFNEPGAYVLVDGQYGSTGKGLLAGYMSPFAIDKVNIITTNAGPNSGHTAFIGDEKIVTRQVPVMSVALKKMSYNVDTYLNAGAIIDPKILCEEDAKWLDYRSVYINPTAALITDQDIKMEKFGIERSIASTGKGIGSAIARKINRRDFSIAEDYYMPVLPAGRTSWDNFWNWNKDVCFVETAQGFSLGLNSSQFYPNVTSRECSVMQAISDARIPAQMVKKVVMCCRTYPIRVGNTEGSSGSYYPDQHEMTWEEVGQEPELTTVTKRQRRIFSWSRIQFREAVAANRPDVIFLNFVQYCKSNSEIYGLICNIAEDYVSVMNRPWGGLLLGYGPRSEDIKVSE